jgi:invasion protein IalB
MSVPTSRDPHRHAAQATRVSYRCAFATLLLTFALVPVALAQAPRKPPAANPPAAASSATPAPKDPNAPQTSTSSSTFEDWTVRCEARPPAPKACEVAQTIATRNPQQQQSVIAEIVFGRITRTDPMRLVIQLPPGVYLPPGANLVIDDKSPPLAAVFTRCLQTCMAEAEVKPETIQALRAQAKPEAKPEPGRLEFEDGTQRKLALPVSFKGLAAALAAREEQAQ